jgi:hypothetical protein
MIGKDAVLPLTLPPGDTCHLCHLLLLTKPTRTQQATCLIKTVVEIDSLPQIKTVVEGSEWHMSRAFAHLKAKGGLEVPLSRKQARRHGPNSRPRPRCPCKGWRQRPMPYGPAFSAILCRSTKVPRKSSPTGHRFAEAIGSRRAARNPPLRKPQLGRVGSNRRHRPRRAADRR